jgi:hypothetical protein
VLKGQGHLAVDADWEGYRHWVHRVTGEVILDPSYPVPPGWLEQFAWRIGVERVQSLAATASSGVALQFSRHRYLAWAYWLAVVGVGVFGTMAADVLHIGFHVPYIASSTCMRLSSPLSSYSGNGLRRRSRSARSTLRAARPSIGRSSSPPLRWARPWET